MDVAVILATLFARSWKKDKLASAVPRNVKVVSPYRI